MQEQTVASRTDRARRGTRRSKGPLAYRMRQERRRLVFLGGDGDLLETVRSVAAAAELELSLDADMTYACAVLITPESSGELLFRPAGIPLILVGANDDPGLWHAATRVRADHIAPLPRAAPWLAGFLSCAQYRPEQARVISVLGVSGGAGVSTLTLLLSHGFAEATVKTLTVDADPYGAGLEFLFSGTTDSALSWQDLPADGRPLDPDRLLAALPGTGGNRLLGFGDQPIMLEGLVVESALDAAAESFDLILADLGRGVVKGPAGPSHNIGKSASTTAILARSDCVLCVVPASIPGMLAARRMRESLPGAFLIARGPFPEGLDAHRMADALDTPLLGVFPRLRGLADIASRDQITAMARHRAIRKLDQKLLEVLGRAGR